jgi:hypothetical protein
MGPAPARCNALPPEPGRVPCAAGPRCEAARGACAVRARGAPGGRARAARALRLEPPVRAIYFVTCNMLKGDGSDTAALEKEYKHNVRCPSSSWTSNHAHTLDRPCSKPKSSRSSAPRPRRGIRGGAEERPRLGCARASPRTGMQADVSSPIPRPAATRMRPGNSTLLVQSLALIWFHERRWRRRRSRFETEFGMSYLAHPSRT